MGSACNTLVVAGLAEIDPMVSVIWSDETIARYGSFLGGVYMWTFIVISTLILFNILLSIIVDSYFNYKEAKMRYGILTVSESFLLTLRMLSYDFRNQYFARAYVWRLHNCCKKKNETNGNHNIPAFAADVVSHQELQIKEEGEGSESDAIANSKKPHSFSEEIEYIHKRMPFPKPAYTYQLRRALRELVGVYLSDRLIHILRRRTVDLKHSKTERQLDIIFPEHNRNSAYTMELLMRIRDRLDKEDGKIA
eukprot:CAMPEP_0204831974 /NCGR_PEP_ID=MMETSP1346-20131115/12268_1 /ASSEMBLY_ACC=CAM_ASM_000771 /TAXON_ID=215587 /ORGANISM="Aplanochytrium stocchinoi, Strain GSBS06" /LENGTH=250 /DNA_ID=CAMNT_0051963453 /DNA_START=388 /DNA_END=1140 /DNA_ORIENTATION=+